MWCHQMIVLHVCRVLFAVFLSTSPIISGAFVYFHWYKNKQLDFKKDIPDVEYSKTEALIYQVQLNI